MKYRRRITLLAAAAAIALICTVAQPNEVHAKDKLSSVMGTVRYVQGSVITVAGKQYDLAGVPVRDAETRSPVAISSLQGKPVEIVFRNRNINSATVYSSSRQ